MPLDGIEIANVSFDRVYNEMSSSSLHQNNFLRIFFIPIFFFWLVVITLFFNRYVHLNVYTKKKENELVKVMRPVINGCHR